MIRGIAVVADRTLDSGHVARVARIRNRVRAVVGVALACGVALGAPGFLSAWSAGPIAPLEVAAAEAASTCSGSIVVKAHHQVGGKEMALAGDTYSLALVAMGSVEGSTAKFSTVKEFEAYACDWSSLDAAGLRSKAKKMDAFARENGLFSAGDAVTDGDGAARFGSVRCGVYLLSRTASAPENERVLIDPVLVLVPYGVDGELHFGVEVTPKSEDPNKPIDPGDPDGPDKPVDPEDPDKPVDPEEPDVPDNPDGPDGPVGPDGPGKPDNPLDDWLEENGLPQTGDVQFQVAAVLLVAGVTMLVTSGLLRRRGAQGADDSDDPDDAEVDAEGDDSDCPDGLEGAEGPEDTGGLEGPDEIEGPDGSESSNGLEGPDEPEDSAELGGSGGLEGEDAPEADR